MKNRRNFEKVPIVIACGLIAFQIAFVVGWLFVAAHFITKFW